MRLSNRVKIMLFFLLVSVAIYAQVPASNQQKTDVVGEFQQVPTRVAAGTRQVLNLRASSATHHQISWTSTPAVTAITVTVAANTDGVTFFTLATSTSGNSSYSFDGAYRQVGLTIASITPTTAVVNAIYTGSSVYPNRAPGQPVMAAALSGTVVTVVTGPAVLDSYYCNNADASAVAYIQLFDISGTVTLGSSTPKWSIGIPPANAAANLSDINLQFFNAIKVAATTTATGSTPATTAVNCNFGYR